MPFARADEISEGQTSMLNRLKFVIFNNSSFFILTKIIIIITVAIEV